MVGNYLNLQKTLHTAKLSGVTQDFSQSLFCTLKMAIALNVSFTTVML